ncbi:hypothetical protein [Synechocystis sp. PCC 7509]|uniref:hypothetical protein n=1 Tax=Synechocystis sp. PCC 7509 TaxID=927677 RepID=UPI0002AC5A3D|nr:hypothetical protein [Synechocystis sp. PCC 7509]
MKIKFLTYLISPLVISVVAIGATSAQTKITNQSRLAINGIGSIRVGMTVTEASRASGTKLVSSGDYIEKSCYYVQPQGAPKGLGFMVTEGRIARVDVYNKSSVTTLSGAKIGDSEARIKALYPGQIKVSAHKYTGDSGGHYLTFVPKDKSDRNYRVVFETDGKRVTNFRSGKLPEVEYVEGCS